ncbi:hypothetical protein EV421DRAFT_1737734 [Armillaria borealis]|uniref:Uncharacterized protein n=1 Tax=Armillaria borealis TaxID=47425 RepID=A0AA39MMN8_9AGAR|nr:hypothetical protein EV421DRAFT_1737734 [Armillaria borealis]
MSSESESEPGSNSSHSTHLGTSWEIAVVSVCVVVVIALVATTIFHFRRKAWRARQMQLDAEQGQAGHEMDPETSSKIRLDSDLTKNIFSHYQRPRKGLQDTPVMIIMLKNLRVIIGTIGSKSIISALAYIFTVQVKNLENSVCP